MAEPAAVGSGFVRGRLGSVLAWCLATAVAIWVAGTIGRIALSAVSHEPFALIGSSLGPVHPSWHVTAAAWISWFAGIGEVAVKGLVGLLLALGLRDAARRYGRRGDVRSSTTPDRSAR